VRRIAPVAVVIFPIAVIMAGVTCVIQVVLSVTAQKDVQTHLMAVSAMKGVAPPAIAIRPIIAQVPVDTTAWSAIRVKKVIVPQPARMRIAFVNVTAVARQLDVPRNPANALVSYVNLLRPQTVPVVVTNVVGLCNAMERNALIKIRLVFVPVTECVAKTSVLPIVKVIQTVVNVPMINVNAIVIYARSDFFILGLTLTVLSKNVQ